MRSFIILILAVSCCLAQNISTQESQLLFMERIEYTYLLGGIFFLLLGIIMFILHKKQKTKGSIAKEVDGVKVLFIHPVADNAKIVAFEIYGACYIVMLGTNGIVLIDKITREDSKK